MRQRIGGPDAPGWVPGVFRMGRMNRQLARPVFSNDGQLRCRPGFFGLQAQWRYQ